MKAGRELDALVAEHVMGLTLGAWCGCDPFPYYGDWDKNPPHPGPCIKEAKSKPKPYSTDITAAWEVLRHLSKTGHWSATLRHDSDFAFEVCLTAGDPNCSHNKPYDPKDGHGWSVVDTEDMMEELEYRDLSAPEAICLAVLMAVGYDIFGGKGRNKVL